MYVAIYPCMYLYIYDIITSMPMYVLYHVCLFLLFFWKLVYIYVYVGFILCVLISSPFLKSVCMGLEDIISKNMTESEKAEWGREADYVLNMLKYIEERVR